MITDGVPALPYEQMPAGVNDAAVQVGRVTGLTPESASRNGYRFVGRWAQDANPIINGQLQYVYQGFTNDGENLVSFWFPVTTAALPDTIRALPDDQMALFDSDPQAYIDTQIEMLNRLTAADFSPNLDELDALVASLLIEEMPADGLSGNVWRPMAVADAPGGTLTAIPDAQNYSVSYFAERQPQLRGRLQHRRGHVHRGWRGGRRHRARSLAPARWPPATPIRGARTLVNTLTAAQSFRVLPGGEPHACSTCPTGGPVVTFVKIGPADEVPPELPPVIILPTPDPVIPMGRVTANPGVNVRSGPGTDYPIIGFANFGATGQIVGRDAAAEWWATPLSSARRPGWPGSPQRSSPRPTSRTCR